MNDEQRARWSQIKGAYQRVKVMGGAQDDPATRVTAQLSLVGERLEQIRDALAVAASRPSEFDFSNIDGLFTPFLEKLQEILSTLAEARSDSSETTARGGSAGPEAAEQLGDIVRRLAEIGDSIAIASGSAPDASAALSPYLERLDATLQGLASNAGDDTALESYLDRLDATLQAVVTAPRGGEVVPSDRPC